MSLILLTQPEQFCPAYKPVRWSLRSLRAPVNNIPGETLAISNIGVVTQAQADLYGNIFSAGDRYFTVQQGFTTLFPTGQAVRVTGTQGHDGVWRVLKNIADGWFIIDSTGTTNEQLVGDVSKHYERYRVGAKVRFLNRTEEREYLLDASGDGRFYLDVRNQAQRSFDSVFNLVGPSAILGVIPADGYISNRYTIEWTESYMVPDADGLPVVETFPAEVAVPGPKEYTVVNAVPPYAHTSPFTGATDLDWNPGMFRYIARNANIGSSRTRFLTYAPAWDNTENTVMDVGIGDAHYLAFLTTEHGQVNVRISFYNAAGTLIGNAGTTQDYPIGSGIIPIGPRNIPGFPAAAATYRVELRRVIDFQPITDTHTFRVDRACHRSPRRIYGLNKLGGIDAYTFTGYEKREETMERDTIKRPTMEPVILGTGSWMERVWRVEPRLELSMLTQTIKRPWLQYIGAELLRSPSTWTEASTSAIPGITATTWWSPLILEGDNNIGFEHGRLQLQYRLGVDNMVQQT